MEGQNTWTGSKPDGLYLVAYDNYDNDTDNGDDNYSTSQSVTVGSAGVIFSAPRSVI